MPNAQRKKEYLRIYEDITRQNEIPVSYTHLVRTIPVDERADARYKGIIRNLKVLK